MTRTTGIRRHPRSAPDPAPLRLISCPAYDARLTATFTRAASHALSPAGRGEGICLARSVDIELVALWVLHPDRVVVHPFLGQCARDGGAQAGQPAGLRVDSHPASLDRVRPLATGVDVEVQPVLDRLGIWDDVEPDARPMTLRVADPVRPVDQFLLGHPQLAVEVVPGSESSRGQRELIAQRGGPEPSQSVRVGTVD